MLGLGIEHAHWAQLVVSRLIIALLLVCVPFLLYWATTWAIWLLIAAQCGAVLYGCFRLCLCLYHHVRPA